MAWSAKSYHSNDGSSMNAVAQALLAFSRQEITGHSAVRAMAEGNEWYVPALFATDKLKTAFADNAVILSTEFDAGSRQLVLFSDRSAVDRAVGRPYGPISGPFPGGKIFEAVQEKDFDVVDINPGSPRELTFFMEASTFPVVRMIAGVVHLEQALERSTADYVPLAELRAHAGFLVVTAPEGHLFTMELNGLTGQFAVLFTAPDRVDAYARLAGAKPKTVAVGGESIFTQLGRVRIEGAIINPGSPKNFVLPSGLFPHIVAAT
ncbi:MAG TPA: SseB family protein [Bryobacteraceae bacterium]|nr:SseB family protein [Bryobacteraceae bacterium]